MASKAVIDEAWAIVSARKPELVDAIKARFGSLAVAEFLADAAAVGVEGAEPEDGGRVRKEFRIGETLWQSEESRRMDEAGICNDCAERKAVIYVKGLGRRVCETCFDASYKRRGCKRNRLPPLPPILETKEVRY